jgi:hypothetical protein
MPPKTVLRTREQLAALWLPWCVDACNPSMPLVDSPARHPRAAQLGLKDLDTPVIQQALARQPYRAGELSWQKIIGIADGYRAQVARGEPIVVDDVGDALVYEQPMVMVYGDVTMLCEGSHRSSALWISQASVFELRLAVCPCRWPDYDNQQLRLRGRPFRAARISNQG